MIGFADPPIGRCRGSPGETGVRSLGVVIGDPPGKTSAQLRAGLEGVEIDALVFERSPQPLDEHVVHPAASAVHADAHLVT